MTVKIPSIGLKGLEGYQVQVQVVEGKESMVIVGLPDTSVKESKERVLSAMHSLDCDMTEQKVVVNLSPSEQRKNSPLFDLAIAIGILKERGECKEQIPHDSVFIGALSLDGTVEKVEGMLPALMAAKSLGFKKVYLPYDPLIPFDMFEGLECIVIQHINDVLQHLSGQGTLPLIQPPQTTETSAYSYHSASSISIIGGGTTPKPGEISLAHRGVLFLDEMAEFPKKTLDMLRQPLEAGKVTISRAQSTVTYPSSFILIAAMNPCPCGYLGSNSRYCTCTPKQVQSYKNRISGPIYDRIDILLFLQSVNLDQPEKSRTSSGEIRKRVEKAWERQYERYQEHVCNAKVPFEKLMATSPLKEHQMKMIRQVSTKRQWSNRVQIKIIRLARTISDLEGSRDITDESIWQAINLRREEHLKEKIIAEKTLASCLKDGD